MTQRVVITGSGIVCPIGHDVETMWKNLLAGNSGMDKTTTFDASTCPTTFSAEVKDFDLGKHIKNIDLHKTSNRHTAFCIGATAQACTQAGIQIESDQPTDGIDRRKMGIYLGAGEGSVDNDHFFDVLVQAWNDNDRQMDWKKWGDYAFANFSEMKELEQEPVMPASHLAMLTGARGPSRSCLTACAASTQAIGEAYMMVREGKANIMIAGGAHSMIHPLGVMGFSRLTAISTRNDSPQTASRPFSASRDGFVLGEGAAIIILESLDSAKKRGAKILAELIGFGSTGDAFRVTDMHEDARGAVQAIQVALKDADVSYKDIDYISTHGTSTAENDSIETKAIKKVFKEEAKNTPASSPKSVFGHLIGATGCAEFITCIMAIRDNTLPPTMNLNDPDPELDLDFVPNQARKANVNIAMNESFGFGGQNNVLILKRFEE
jgi:3-oxoacyl-[acyl-carrier-protein] synthase II